MGNEVYLNGYFLPKSEAKISVMDRGFLFADGVYEVIPCYAGHPFRLMQHLQRLEQNLNAIHMVNPLSRQQWEEILEILTEQLPEQDQSIYIQITRGSDNQRDHRIPHHIEPTVFAMTSAIQTISPSLASQGIEAITLEDNRWLRCNIKSTALLANVLLKNEAHEQKAMEAILIRDQCASEGTASNLFIVKDSVIITPPRSANLLPGITRDLILELAEKSCIPYREEKIEVSTLQQADEIWLTSSTKEIMPVTTLNHEPVNNGKPGPLFKQLHGLYSDYKQKLQSGDIEI